MLVKGFKVDRKGRVICRYEKLLLTIEDVNATLLLLEELDFINWCVQKDGKTVKTNFLGDLK